MSVKISDRAANTQASPIRKLVPLAMEAKARGVKVYHLNIGQPDIPTHPAFLNAVHSFPHKVLQYSNSQGLPEYIEWLIKYYQGIGIELEKDEIMVTSGGSEAVIFAIFATTNPGDNILVFEPFYTNYNGYATMASVDLIPITTHPETGYHPPGKEEIESKINDRTRAIMICSPNNPTGTVLTRDEIEMITEIAIEHNLFLISDEVYREYFYENEPISVLSLPQLGEKAVLLDSISKRFSACGARVGCIATHNKDLLKACIRFGQARLCSPTIEQYGAKAVLESLEPKYFDDMRAEFRARRDVLYEELMKIDGLICKKPTGAFYIMAKFPINDIEDFAKWLLTDFQTDGATTMIAPGPGFYATKGLGNSEARVAYVLNTEDIKKALKILQEAVSVYNSKK
ncbi:pyridoxal phosphate-dependent aminotransferase [bacterium]|nr:pyridoxal phosphate-dependent aminotransferase [bacterium]